MAFAHFDGVIAPMLIASTDFKIIYSNFSAQRRFPFLTDENALLVRYDSSDLQKALAVLETGTPYKLPYESFLGLSLVFSPFCSRPGKIDYICVYVSYDQDMSRDLFPLMTDNELILAMKKDLIPSLHYATMQTKFGEEFVRSGQTEKASLVFRSMRLKLLSQLLFVYRVSESQRDRKGDYCLCDASSVLQQVSEVFKHMKYKPSEVCVVPVDRASLVLLFTDVLANLALRQQEPNIRVSALSQDDGVSVRFSTGPLSIPLNVPCEDGLNGIDIGNYSVLQKMESLGGSVSVKRCARGAVTVTLKFPYPSGILRIPELNDRFAHRLSMAEEAALEYLLLISDPEIANS